MASGHQDGVAAEGCCVRVVGDEDEGALTQAGAYALDEQTFGLGVEGGGWLIEQEDAALAEEAACYGDSLGLSFAESGSAFAAEGVEAVREVEDEVSDRCVEGVAHLFVCGVCLAYEKVVTDSAADQGVALWDVDDVTAGARRGLYGLAGAVILYCSLVWGEEGEHESYEGALAYAGLSHDGCHGAWTEVVGESFDDVSVAVRVAEGDVFEADSELSFESDRFAFFFLRKVELTEAVDGGYRVDQRRYLLGYLGDRALDLADELEEGGHGTEGYGVGCNADDAP